MKTKQYTNLSDVSKIDNEKTTAALEEHMLKRTSNKDNLKYINDMVGLL